MSTIIPESIPASLPELAVEPLRIAGREFRSRLILGSGKYVDNATMVRSFEAAGTEIVTVAVRRVNLAS